MFDGAVGDVAVFEVEVSVDFLAVIDLEEVTRAEARAASERLRAIADLVHRRCVGEGKDPREFWSCDGWSSAAAEVGAASALTIKAASTQMSYALALRHRLPMIAALFAQGRVGYRLVAMICWRTRLIIDATIVAAVDAALARDILGWGPMSNDKAQECVDFLIDKHDPDAVIRQQSAACGVGVHLGKADDVAGTASLWGALLAPDAAVFDARLEQIITGVCKKDGRTRGQLRAQAVGALAAGVPLGCQCGDPDCKAAAAAAEAWAKNAVIHVVAEQAALDAPPDPHRSGGPDNDDVDDDDPFGRPPGSADPAGDDEPSGQDEPVGEDEPSGENEPQSGDEEPLSDDDLPGGDYAADPDSVMPQPGPEATPGAEGLPEDAAAEPEREPDDPGPESALSQPDPPTHPQPRPTISEVPRWAQRRARQARALIVGHGVIPAVQVADLVRAGAKIRYLKPGHEFHEPEPGYRPSAALAAHVRARDLHCRAPGCTVPATRCDIDHTIPYAIGGQTHPSNLKCLCRRHHLLKTWWTGKFGWSDVQRSDGSVTWTTPSGRQYTTKPGSLLYFPKLCIDTGKAPIGPPRKEFINRELAMPMRRITRAEQRRQNVKAERERNAAQRLLEELAAGMSGPEEAVPSDKVMCA